MKPSKENLEFALEWAVLEILLADIEEGQRIPDIIEILGTDGRMFNDVTAGKVYELLVSMHGAGILPDMLALTARMPDALMARFIRTEVDLDDFWTRYRHANAQYFAVELRDKWVKRSLGEAVHQAEIECRSNKSAAEVISAVNSALQDVQGHCTPTDSMIGALRGVQDAIGHLERLRAADGKVTGIPSGIHRLDSVTGGFQPGDLVVLAARPAIGKSAFALNVAHHAAVKGKPVLFASLEMSSTQLWTRIITIAGNVRIDRLSTGWLSADAMEQAKHAAEKTKALPITICCTPEPRSCVHLSVPVIGVRFMTLSPIGLTCRSSQKWPWASK